MARAAGRSSRRLGASVAAARGSGSRSASACRGAARACRANDARVAATLVVLGSERAAARSEREILSLVDSWDAALTTLPRDWSDLAAEVRLLSSDYVERAVVLCVQMNPRRVGEEAAFRFRSARRAGYGVAPEMARRCFERCAAESIRGSVEVLRALSDTQLEATQGPVWIVDGHTV